MELEFLSTLFGDDAVNSAMIFTFTVAGIGFIGLCIYSWLSSLWEQHIKENGFYVTAAPVNGKDWDGAPMESINPDRLSHNFLWLKEAITKPRIVMVNANTDYAQWDVLTWMGIKRAMPGDIITKTIFGYKVIKPRR